CGKNGHISSKCRSKNKKKKTKEAVHLVEVPDHSRVYATTNGETIVDLGQGNNEHEEEESSHFIEECFFTNEVEPKDDSFTLDCGSSIHIVKDKAKLENPRRCSVTIRGVNGRSGAAMEGEVQFGKMKLENVKFASSSPRNLLSAHLLTEKGYDILLSNADAKVFYGNVFVISFPKIGKFWEISSKNADSEMVFNV
ncbi:hypothetical protein, partial [Pseudomonas laurentiana]|uniref:hypothetical protein n=1 Tax=Pseudomonas laurentiana TaxID=2364649 RepID=UPI001679F60D